MWDSRAGTPLACLQGRQSTAMIMGTRCMRPCWF
jgi:lipoate synthase